MAKPKNPPTATDAEVRALLERFECPLPFHAVRSRFLGTIASPDPRVTPMKSVEALWGGELPVFDNMNDFNALIGALVMGLWNRLSAHQERSAPFRLIRIEVPATREGVVKLALMREQELQNFREGLFGDNEALDLPERAHKAVGVLSEIRAIIEGVRELAQNPAKELSPEGSADLLRQFRELTKVAEHEIHEAMLSCTRARRDMMRGRPATGPVFH